MVVEYTLLQVLTSYSRFCVLMAPSVTGILGKIIGYNMTVVAGRCMVIVKPKELFMFNESA